MYEPTYWKDEVVENPYRYKETQNSDGSIEHVPDPGEVLQEGTEQSATNFNHMEQGILEAHEMSAEAVRMLKSVMRKVEGLDGEKVTVTLRKLHAIIRRILSQQKLPACLVVLWEILSLRTSC